MKVSPVAAGTDRGPVNLEEGHSAGNERIQRAKAILSGQDPTQVPQKAQDTQVERAQNSIRKMKMRTNVTPKPYLPPVRA